MGQPVSILHTVTYHDAGLKVDVAIGYICMVKAEGLEVTPLASAKYGMLGIQFKDIIDIHAVGMGTGLYKKGETA